jgi:uncharacterized protein
MIHLSNSASIPARYLNRHCLITGPTGTGKTVTLMRMVESIVAQGTPVFAPDIKGDLSALSAALPTTAHNATVPVWAFGADLLSRALELTDAQAGALEIAFAYAHESGAPFTTLTDFRTVLATIASNPDFVAHIGHVTRASVGTIQRALLRAEAQGASDLFDVPALDVGAMIDAPRLHLLDARALYHSPALYGAFLLYILRELATRLPEAGDLERPRLVLVFDEAHTIFHEASPSLLRSVEATARLIRSKGVGLVWASQSPDDIPLIVRAQCATTIAHSNTLGVGRALFSTLGPKGPTTPVVISPTPAAPFDAVPDIYNESVVVLAKTPPEAPTQVTLVATVLVAAVALGAVGATVFVLGGGLATLATFAALAAFGALSKAA